MGGRRTSAHKHIVTARRTRSPRPSAPRPAVDSARVYRLSRGERKISLASVQNDARTPSIREARQAVAPLELMRMCVCVTGRVCVSRAVPTTIPAPCRKKW
eukprot:6251191-Prymnesium_polylepis.1